MAHTYTQSRIADGGCACRICGGGGSFEDIQLGMTVSQTIGLRHGYSHKSNTRMAQ